MRELAVVCQCSGDGSKRDEVVWQEDGVMVQMGMRWVLVVVSASVWWHGQETDRQGRQTESRLTAEMVHEGWRMKDGE
jgi:hypothetical protein